MNFLDSMDPNVRDYLLKKKQEREAAQAAISTPNPLEALSGAFATIGAGFTGGDPIKAAQSSQQGFNQQREAKLNNLNAMEDKKLQDLSFARGEEKYQREQAQLNEENDPSSAKSKLAQSLVSKMAPGKDYSNLSATQINSLLPSLSKIYEIEQKKLDRIDSREQKIIDRDLKKEEKLRPIEEKKKATLTEIEDRRTNIKDNIKLLKDQINKYGTYETFGPQNADMERRVDQIATDMAKLTDPNSVARPSEVDMFKKGLVSPTLGQKNSTALSILDSFEKEVDQRAANAYRLRGLENPQTSAPTQMDASARQKRIQELKAKLGK